MPAISLCTHTHTQRLGDSLVSRSAIENHCALVNDTFVDQRVRQRQPPGRQASTAPCHASPPRPVAWPAIDLHSTIVVWAKLALPLLLLPLLRISHCSCQGQRCPRRCICCSCHKPGELCCCCCRGTRCVYISSLLRIQKCPRPNLPHIMHMPNGSTLSLYECVPVPVCVCVFMRVRVCVCVGAAFGSFQFKVQL